MKATSNIDKKEIKRILFQEVQFIERLTGTSAELKFLTKISHGLIETTVYLFYNESKMVSKCKGYNQVSSLKNALLKLNRLLLKKYKKKNYKFKYLHDRVSC